MSLVKVSERERKMNLGLGLIVGMAWVSIVCILVGIDGARWHSHGKLLKIGQKLPI